ncbi:hypothetical protein [Vagococcus zengguangii]|uniref:Uncharacterized protein n=1 Tax=Vagococcus zengguangii TaxID=2571750 RepID=A0A4D7CYJ3_9ENTE|nr:hypothetical protein [Vagococcus zengguangii]QCI86930.1 hypothetical protein FA707_08100 [Vagococcus zengguangii]TLG81028.1 hypothetical protein FE258_03860 [Vagococcus zengguangii]
MKENFDQEFDKLMDLFKENIDLFEQIISDLTQTGIKRRIDIELEEFSEFTGLDGNKEWQQQDFEHLFSTLSHLFSEEMAAIMYDENYSLGFEVSKYLYNKLLPIGMQPYFINYNKETFEFFHQTWKKCYHGGSKSLKKEMMKWLKSEREDIRIENAIGQWRGIYILMYSHESS